MRRTPDIGRVVLHFHHETWIKDWVAQVRLGDEQFVLVWGNDKTRHKPGLDVWKEIQ